MSFFVLDEANDRSRSIKGINAKANARQAKEIEFDGTREDYKRQLMANATDKQKRSLIRRANKKVIDAKKQGRKYEEDIPMDQVGAAYDPTTKTISVNKKFKQNIEAQGGSIDPLVDHEKRHHEQAMAAKDKFGNQGSRQLMDDYVKQVYGKAGDKFNKKKYDQSKLEYDANKAAAGLKGDVGEVVKSLIQSKKSKGSSSKVSAKEGQQANAEMQSKLMPSNNISDKDVPDFIKKKVAGQEKTQAIKPNSRGGINSPGTMDKIDKAIDNFGVQTQIQQQQKALLAKKKQQQAMAKKQKRMQSFYQPQQLVQQAPVAQPAPAPQPGFYQPQPMPAPAPQPVQPVPQPVAQQGFYHPQQPVQPAPTPQPVQPVQPTPQPSPQPQQPKQQQYKPGNTF